MRRSIQSIFRTSALLSAMSAAAPLAAQDGLRFGGAGLEQRAAALVRHSHVAEDGEVRLVLTPLGGQGFSFSPEGWAVVGFRMPAGFDVEAPSRFGLAPATGAAVDYHVDRWTLSSSLRQGLTPVRTDFARLDFGASYGLPVANRHALVLSGGLGFGASGGLAPTAGEDFAATQAVAPIGAGTGLRDLGLRLSWRYSLDRNLFVNTSVGVDRMFADPIGANAGFERNVGSVGAVFGYRFY